VDFTIQKVERYGVMVWEHTEMDKLRKEHCLCLDCRVIKTCDIAKTFFKLCQTYNVAFAMTRCPAHDSKTAIDSGE